LFPPFQRFLLEGRVREGRLLVNPPLPGPLLPMGGEGTFKRGKNYD